jgi:hypothetical protein
MGDLLGSLVWGAKSRQYCVIGGVSLQGTSEWRACESASCQRLSLVAIVFPEASLLDH